jgi:hypothetical protein
VVLLSARSNCSLCKPSVTKELARPYRLCYLAENPSAHHFSSRWIRIPLDSESGPEPEEPMSATSQPESPPLPAVPLPATLPPFVPPPHPPLPPDNVEMEQPVNAPHPVELKAGLPDNFSGNAEDAARWLLAISAYFAMNATI